MKEISDHLPLVFGIVAVLVSLLVVYKAVSRDINFTSAVVLRHRIEKDRARGRKEWQVWVQHGNARTKQEWNTFRTWSSSSFTITHQRDEQAGELSSSLYLITYTGDK